MPLSILSYLLLFIIILIVIIIIIIIIPNSDEQVSIVLRFLLFCVNI